MSTQQKLANKLFLICAFVLLLFHFPASAQIPVGFVPSFNIITSKDGADKSCLGGSTCFETLRFGSFAAFGISFDWAEEKWLGTISGKSQDYLYSAPLKISLGLGHSDYPFDSRSLFVGASASMNYIDEPDNSDDFPIYGVGGWIDVALHENIAFKINLEVLKSLNEDKKYYLSKASFILWKWFSINISMLRDKNNKFNFITVCPGIFIRDFAD